jgi:hypothetical protein
MGRPNLERKKWVWLWYDSEARGSDLPGQCHAHHAHIKERWNEASVNHLRKSHKHQEEDEEDGGEEEEEGNRME